MTMIGPRALVRKKQRELEELRAQRRKRFRMLVCLNGTDPSYVGVDIAAKIASNDDCDIVLLYVRRIDQGLNTGGLQMRAARQNMLEWGLELPGIKYLKRGLDQLLGQGILGEEWEERIDHTDVFGDPLGDNKIEYRSSSGKSIVLKLKIAPDVSSGILDQYELGPYNLIIMGPPKRWRGEFRAWRDPSSVQKVAMLAPSSVMTVRGPLNGKGFLLCADGSVPTAGALVRGAVLAHSCGEPVEILAVAKDDKTLAPLERRMVRFEKHLAGKGIKVTGVSVETGDPVTTIVDRGATHSAIVVADSGKSKITRFLAGSVAFDVMGKAGTSVINIR
jgi:nucleotide-binding universal stress UspA family protein